MTKQVEINPNMQYIFGVDISASMNNTDGACGGQTRYSYALEKLQSFIQISQDYDPDGPTVALFGESVTVYPNTTLEAVSSKLSAPTFEGFTNTAEVISAAYDIHKKEKAALNDGLKHPGTVLMIFTDGEPTNRQAVERVITQITHEVEAAEEFNITFLTVGTIDSNLQAWLTALDDDLKAAKHDIVDVKRLEEVSFLKAVAGAVND